MRTTQEVRKGSRVKKRRFLGMARMFFAAADPVRIEIMLYLKRQGEACVSDIAKELDMSIAAISHHLQILRECRCLKTIRSGSMVCYRFMPNSFTDFVTGWSKNETGG